MSNYWNRYWQQRAAVSRRRFVGGAAASGAGVAGFALVGCGDDDDGDGGTDPTATQGSGGETPQASPSEPSGPSTARVRVGLAVEPPSIDPHDSTGGTDDFYLGQMYSSLFRWGRDGLVEPDLAESFEVAEDGSSVTFTLREGVTFHNGDPFTAEDVAYSFERVRTPDFRRSTVPFIPVESVDTPDDRTATFVLSQPDASFIAGNFGSLLIAPKAYLESTGYDGFQENPVGTGPYTLAERNQGSGARFERFADYYAGPAGFAGADYSIIPEGTSRVDALEVGDVDMVSAVPPELAARINGIDGARAVANPTNTDTIYSFALEAFADVPESDLIVALRDKRVRQAINYAVDKQGIADVIYGSEFATPFSVTHAGQPFHVGEPYGYDPERAQQLLGEAGVSGLSMPMYQPTGRIPGADQIGTIVQSNLAEVGFEPNLQLLEFSVFITRLRDDVEPHNDGMIFAWATTGSYTSPFQGAQNKWTCDSPYGQWCNEEFDSMLDRARTIFEEEERNQVVQEAFSLLREEAPGLWVVLLKEPYGLRSDVVADWRTRDGNNATLRIEDLVPA